MYRESLLLFTLTALVASCAAEEAQDDRSCDPADAMCVCLDSTGITCDPESGADCSCTPLSDNNEEGKDLEDQAFDDVRYRFVLIEDMTQDVSGPYPGVDLDAVLFLEGAGILHYASVVEDFNLANNGPNEAMNIDAALGAPDADCTYDDSTFVSLGGLGGYIVVSFGTTANDVVITKNNSIIIHEVGDDCPDNNDDRDSYTMSVSVFNDNGFVEVVSNLEGTSIISTNLIPAFHDHEEPEYFVDPIPEYRFVLIEDKSPSVSGAYPGMDLDAVQLTKADGDIHYATAVEDFNLADNNSGLNEATDINAALGAPDDDCADDDSKFVALGGLGGYIVVSFGTAEDDTTIENGDSVVVHEIGRGACPNNTYDDDPYTLSVSVYSNSGFIYLAEDAEGVAPIPIRGLP